MTLFDTFLFIATKPTKYLNDTTKIEKIYVFQLSTASTGTSLTTFHLRPLFLSSSITSAANFQSVTEQSTTFRFRDLFPNVIKRIDNFQQFFAVEISRSKYPSEKPDKPRKILPMGFNTAPVYYHTFKLRFWFWVCVLARFSRAQYCVHVHYAKQDYVNEKAIILIVVRRVIS